MQIDRLISAIGEMHNPTTLGLDTKIDYVPKSFAAKFSNDPDAVFHFNAALLEGLVDIVPCVKIQIAYYELMGLPGMECFAKTLSEAKRLGYVTIVDAKRGDIDASASAYSSAFLAPDAPFAVDFLTISAYLGIDGIKPFMDDCERTGRGIFALVKTSNPSSSDFQDIKTWDGRPLFEHVAQKVSEWGERLVGSEGYSSLGAVVGATWPEQGRLLREKMPHTFFLVPGYGAQGASAKDLAGCFDANGGGAIVNASRSIICAHKKKNTDDFVSAAREEALRMKEDLATALSKK